MARAGVPEFVFQRFPAKLPSGWTFCPIFPGDERSPLRICAVLETTDSSTGVAPKSGMWRPAASLCVLRDLPDATVVLGGVIDQLGQVSQWLEIWVQQGLEQGAGVERLFQDGLHNELLDARWRERALALRDAGEAEMFWTGYEDRPQAPTYLVCDDRGKWRAAHPTDASGSPWQLCTDDARLVAAGLPAYSTSLSRFLESRSGPAPRLLSVSQVEASGPSVDAATPDLLRIPPEAVALSPLGGRMMVTRYEPLSYEQFLDVVSGQLEEQSVLRSFLGGTAQGTVSRESASSDGWLVAGMAGRWLRLAETLYLKVRVLLDAITRVRDVTARLQCPLLSLSADSFRVHLMAPGPDLPSLWSVQTVLMDGGQAVEVRVGNTNSTYFVPMRRREGGNYQPIAAQRRRAGDTRVRLMGISEPDPETGAQSVELSVDIEDLELKRNDLFHFKCTLGDVRRDLSAFIDHVPDQTETHARISTIPQVFAPPLGRSCEGGQHIVSYRVVPLVSTPFDLHALAVLAVRTLLIPSGGQRALVDAIDRLEQLAKQAAKALKSSRAGETDQPGVRDASRVSPLADRIREVFSSRPEFRETLGPQRLVGSSFGPVTFEEATTVIPLPLWCAVLAGVVRMFPGWGPDSTSQDAGEADRTGVHRVFDPAKSDFSDLLVRARALLVSDQVANREIVDAIKVQLQIETGKF